MNCIIIDDEELSRKVTEQFVKKVDFLHLTDSFSNPVSALTFLSNNKTDLIFLDVEMPEMNGIDLIKAIFRDMPQVILTTSHKEFAVEAFDFNVTDFLLKPINYSRFYSAVLKAKTAIEKQSVHQIDTDTVFVKNGNSITRIKKSDILWAEALGDYITINTENEKIVIHSTMHALETKLGTKDYMRVHRSYIVRIDKIESIEDNAISFNSKLIPIGKSYKSEVLKRLSML